jgi:AraC-like DNA-binding protein
MARIIPVPTHRVRERFPSLRHLGIAVQHVPRYVNRRERQHSIDVVLLSVIVRGRGRHVLGHEVHRETGGSVAVTHYGQAHDIVTDARGMDVYNVFLDLRNHPLPVLPESFRATLSALLPIHPRLQHQLNRRVWIRIDEPERLATSLARMEKELKSSRPGALEIAQHSFQVFLIDVCRAAQRHGFTPSKAEGTAFPPWVERLRQRIDEQFAAAHDLSTLALGVGVSVAYLCRLFKAYTGKTVIEYVIERRIQAAIWKLREGNEKIISIALGCGFNDLAYFNRTFKRIVGTTPSHYRRRLSQAPRSFRRERKKGLRTGGRRPG